MFFFQLVVTWGTPYHSGATGPPISFRYLTPLLLAKLYLLYVVGCFFFFLFQKKKKILPFLPSLSFFSPSSLLPLSTGFSLEPYQRSRDWLTFTLTLTTPQDTRRSSPLPSRPHPAPAFPLFLSVSCFLILATFALVPLPGQLDRGRSPSWLAVVIKHLFLVHLTLGLISYKVN